MVETSLTSYKDPNLRRELIMKHYTSPVNKVDQNPGWLTIDQYSKECVDELHLYLKIDDDKIIDAKFSGVGCAIFLSSSDIMVSELKNKSLKDVQVLINNYDELLKGNSYDETKVGALAIYDNVHKNFNRLHCAEMVSLAVKKATV